MSRSRRLVSILLGLALLSGACAPSPAIPRATRIKILIPEDGWVHVPADALRAAGLDLARIDPSRVQVFDGPTEVPAIRTRDGIQFYAGASPDPGIAEAVYWLRWREEHGAEFEVRHATPRTGDAEAATSFTDELAVEENHLFIPQAVDGDGWFWQSLFAPDEAEIPIALVGRTAGGVRVSVNVWAATEDATVRPDHRLQILWNGEPIAEDRWDGRGPHTVTAVVPEEWVEGESNRLGLRVPGDTGAAVEILHLDRVRVSYPRALRAVGGELYFSSSEPVVRVDGFRSSGIAAYDITDPQAPFTLTGTSAESGPGTWSLTLRTFARGARRFLVRDEFAKPLAPSRVEAMSTIDLRDPRHRADEIIITTPELVDALGPLADWRAGHGISPIVVTTGQVYDDFAFGRRDPAAIRDFISFALDHWEPTPRFVLLVGKATYDPLDHLQGPNRNLLPTAFVPTPNLGHTASDNWFVRENEAPLPRLAIGRIPANTVDEVRVAVDKTIEYESAVEANWRSRAVFVVDPKDPAFAAGADRLKSLIPAAIGVRTIAPRADHSDLNARRADVLREWNAGALLVTYIGHGAIDSWAEGPLFSSEDAAGLSNRAGLPILLTPSCLDGFFYHPEVDSLAEQLLFNPRGGIVAGIVSTGLSYPGPQSGLAEGLLRAWFQERAETLGEAFTRAKRSMPVAAPEYVEVIETFVILGDPALALPAP